MIDRAGLIALQHALLEPRALGLHGCDQLFLRLELR